jgi:hypothetical protein
MNDMSIPEAMDEFFNIVNTNPSTDAADLLVRGAGAMPADVAVTALARLYVLTAARARFDQARAAFAAPVDEPE